MKILFVRPQMIMGRSLDAMPPLVFAILQGLTPPGHETRLFDERVEPVPLDADADLVAITVETYTARRAYEIAAAYRARGVPVVMGGFHPTLATEEVLEHADAVVVGDAEDVWPQLVEEASAGRLRRTYRGDPTHSLEKLHFDRSIFLGKRYSPFTLVQFQRGCRYACDFCSIRAFYGSVTRTRPVSDVVAEIGKLGRRAVFFVDDNLFSDRGAGLELLEALVPLGIQWGAQLSVDAVQEEGTVELMKRSGCRVVLIGFESLDDGSLREMRKSWAVRNRDYHESTLRLHAAGIMIYGTFVFGYDHDSPDSFDETVAFARRHHLFLANFNPLTPTPGTPLYDRLRDEGRLIGDPWWLDPEFRYGRATFRPRGMDADDLTEGCYRARSEFYGWRSVIGRGLGSPVNARNLPLFLAANRISRREIRWKQGRRLGGRPDENCSHQAEHRSAGALPLRR